MVSLVDSGPAMIYKAVEVIWIFLACGRAGRTGRTGTEGSIRGPRGPKNKKKSKNIIRFWLVLCWFWLVIVAYIFKLGWFWLILLKFGKNLQIWLGLVWSDRVWSKL